MLWNFVKLLLFLHFLDLTSAQYCNEDIVTQTMTKVDKQYTEPEKYDAKCAFNGAPSNQFCPYWRNVTKTKTEEKIENKKRTIIICCDGYHLVKKECLPYCEQSCVNGFCSSPGTCSCSKGYTKSPNKDNVCDPVCKSCINGDCVAPNECKCHEGYIMDTASSKCKATCGNCAFGICDDTPNKCKCFQGYEKDADGKCTVKSCPTVCKGGSCVDGKCECSDDLLWDDEKSSCIPICPTIPPTITESQIPENITVLFEEIATTEKPIIDVSLKKKDLLIWGLLLIISLLSTTIILILLRSLYMKRRYHYQDDDTYNIRYDQEDKVMIQAVKKN